MKTILIEDDRVLRVLGVILDPSTDQARIEAFVNFNSTDLDDFLGWCHELRLKLGALYPARVVMINSQDELKTSLPAADAAVIESLHFGEAEIALSTKLKCLHQFGTTLKRIDLVACERAGIKVLSIRRRTNIAMAEHTMMLCLSLAKRFPFITSALTIEDFQPLGLTYTPYDKNHTASPNYARIPKLQTLEDLTLGLVGFGEIAKEVSQRANAFGMKVIVHQPTALTQAEKVQFKVAQMSLNEVLSMSDFISIHVPFSEKTKDLIDDQAFDLMKASAFLINTARAQIVNHDALVKALKRKKIAGAAFDVHYTEPIESSEELLDLPQFIATPHVGGASRMNGLMDAETLLMHLAQCFNQSPSSLKGHS